MESRTLKNVALLSLGDKLDSVGRPLRITPKILGEIVESFREIKARYLPPILSYHFKGDDRTFSQDGEQGLGVIDDLSVVSGRLTGNFSRLQDRFYSLLSGQHGDGFSPYVSVKILPPKHPYNPNPSKWSLGHVALVPLPADPTVGSPVSFSQDTTTDHICYNFGITDLVLEKSIMPQNHTKPDNPEETNPEGTTKPEETKPTDSKEPKPEEPKPESDPATPEYVTRSEISDLIAELRQSIQDLQGVKAEEPAKDDEPAKDEELEPAAVAFSQVASVYSDAYSARLDALVASGNISAASKDDHLRAVMGFTEIKATSGYNFSQDGDPVALYFEALQGSKSGIKSGGPNVGSPDIDDDDPIKKAVDQISNAWRST